MPTILITGAGRGLGLELAKQFAAGGWQVIGTVRDITKGAALPKGVETHLCEISDRRALARLAKDLNGRAIDVLFCNAGMYGKRGQSVGAVDHEIWAEVMRVNVYTPVACVEALVENVAVSTRKQIVMMSSRMGSIGENSAGGEIVYRSSKAALNAATKSIAVELGKRGVTAIAVHPGWVQTDMGGPSATLTPEQSIAGLKRVVEGLTPAENGKFFNYDGAPIAW
jgi:NAD(P)-dependent dehydrogenase (short-subunit alcohol dehydrogenase family)